MEKLVYLAGAIKGLSYGDSISWRDSAKEELAKAGIIGISPMRAKEFLKNEREITDDYTGEVLASDSGIVSRDRFDVENCNIMLANLLGLKEKSTGTMVEYGWADAFRKPIITVIEKEGNPTTTHS
ncbi:MAG: nucleoside 2-deoxyribosyltransferase [Nanoarchaeota archaeon]|nr:nucleoside 2-deoxyribosyltransferase [Nanoarchaeota archaeon]MBU1501804.1 nucleoside 2-deoxyribosyltransferase [Nanoarchaeota archaeon]MBU2459001.1 nucleoside 2-deoxyribosyltransferase [Nanoarchaeota archaeon]